MGLMPYPASVAIACASRRLVRRNLMRPRNLAWFIADSTAPDQTAPLRRLGLSHASRSAIRPIFAWHMALKEWFECVERKLSVHQILKFHIFWLGKNKITTDYIDLIFIAVMLVFPITKITDGDWIVQLAIKCFIIPYFKRALGTYFYA